MTESAINFTCNGHRLFGILHTVDSDPDTGVVVVVGGPQYRVGSHRQFTLLARYLADRGVPVLRFDYRGMGDSEGEMLDFESVQNDIRHAIDHFILQVPTLKKIILWGLCDAASAISFYAHTDERVNGIVILNPWIRTIEGEAKAYLKHYYLTRLVDPELWRKIFSGKFNLLASISSLFHLTKSAVGSDKSPSTPKQEIKAHEHTEIATGSLPERMLAGIKLFKGQILLILSGDDLTADEFRDKVKSSKAWQNIINVEGVVQHTLPKANHTFSQREWRDQVSEWTLHWLKSTSA